MYIANLKQLKEKTEEINTLFVNGRFLTQPVTGVQRFVLETLRQMDLLLNDAEYFPKLQLVCLVPQQAFQYPS